MRLSSRGARYFSALLVTESSGGLADSKISVKSDTAAQFTSPTLGHGEYGQHTCLFKQTNPNIPVVSAVIELEFRVSVTPAQYFLKNDVILPGEWRLNFRQATMTITEKSISPTAAIQGRVTQEDTQYLQAHPGDAVPNMLQSLKEKCVEKLREQPLRFG